MTQMELAELLGVSYQQVQKYEKGNENISVERLRRYARFKCSHYSFYFAGKVG